MAEELESAGAPFNPDTPTTQRAYTLRLRPAVSHSDTKEQVEAKRRELSSALWATHEAINIGAKVFGDWLLTLRGGLEHTLAAAPVNGGKGKPDRAPSDDERRDRRVLLALSWLSVEDERGAPKEPGLIVAYGDDCKSARDSQDGRDRKVVDALRGILAKRGMQPATLDEWVNDCQGSLKARIRDDAVWVNRSAAFDLRVAEVGTSLTRLEVWDMLGMFFKSSDAYFSGIASADAVGGESAGVEGETNKAEPEEKVASPKEEKAKELNKDAGQWLSSRCGDGAGANFESMAGTYAQIIDWARNDGGTTTLSTLARALGTLDHDDVAEGILGKISGPGYKSGTRNLIKKIVSPTSVLAREWLDKLIEKARVDEEACRQKIGFKGQRPYSQAIMADVEAKCGIRYLQEDGPAHHKELSVMLDHAARRISIGHTWIKRSESERRNFEVDAAKLNAVVAEHPSAVRLLNELAQRRGAASGSADSAGVLVRGRALLGWKEVVAAWSRKDCKTFDDRVREARVLQDELEKFGDINLFTELAKDEYTHVWRSGGVETAGDHSILSRYVAGTVAKANQRRFKVPAYRHPDPLRHPVFGDFGNSRWSIDFAIHRRFKTAASGKRKGSPDATWHADDRNLRMDLWTGESVEQVDLRWSSKRLATDLALSEVGAPNAKVVTRADRLGRAAAGHVDPVHVLNIFDNEDNWNGRLQAPRTELERIARLMEKDQKVQAKKLLSRISWLVSFSPKLEPSGPFIEYANEHGIHFNKKKQKFSPNREVNWPSDKSRWRKGQAQVILSRLHSLRLLSVDLGHRFAAACAVWETHSSASFKKTIASGMILRGGSGADDLYCHVQTAGEVGKQRTTIFRRVGADKLPDGSVHPAPWAKLERQFLVKLQGEELPARMAAPDELAMIADWEKTLGLQPLSETSAKPCKDVAELMARAVRMFTLAGRRHFDRARIAHNLIAKYRTKPGGISEPLTEEGRLELLTETLALWHGLFAGDRWIDPMAQNAWNGSGLPKLDLPVRAGEDGTSFGGPGRKVALEAYHAKLRPHAELLTQADLSSLAKRWSDRWTQDDRLWAGKNGLLRSLKKWITPRGLRPTESDSAAVKERKTAAALRARHVGGLSMQRINTLTGLYRFLKSFKNRPEPDNLRKNISQKGDDRLVGFNQRLLDVRDRLREQRVKQLASRITEAALGIGRIKSRRVAAGAARPTLRVDAPCHAVVIESLKNYRPDELQTRRENRQLMEWSSAKVEKYLTESCQLHGLHLRAVQPNYTSRQCSRTGAPGMRGVEVSAHDLVTKPWWRKDVAKAKANLQKAQRDNREGALSDRLLVSAEQWALQIPEQDRQDRKMDSSHTIIHARRIVLPRRGGDLFIAGTAQRNSNGHFPALQADLNAAANIGIRALLDPDWPGKWWWVPCTGGTYTPAPEKTSGAEVFKSLTELPRRQESQRFAEDESNTTQSKKQRSKLAKPKEVRAIENRWRNCSAKPLSDGQWVSSGEYWAKVEADICRLLELQTSEIYRLDRSSMRC